MRLTAETLRAYLYGPQLDGTIEVSDCGSHYRIGMDPCGSGGACGATKPRRNAVASQAAVNFGTTREAHSWSLGQKNVPYYCLHCAVNELLSME